MFSALYRLGKQRDNVHVNPVRDVSQHPVNNGVIRYLRPEEENRFRAVLQRAVDECGLQNDRRKKRLLHRIYELDIALGTGIRKGEQYGLRWRDIDFNQRIIVLRDTKLVAAVCKDPETAAISPKLKALLAIAAHVQGDAKTVSAEMVERARKEGATDLELHDTVLIAAAFCMYNRYVDGLGTWQPRNEEMYRSMGERLAQSGYAQSVSASR